MGNFCLHFHLHIRYVTIWESTEIYEEKRNKQCSWKKLTYQRNETEETDWLNSSGDRVSACLKPSVIHPHLCYFTHKGQGWTGRVKWSNISLTVAFTTHMPQLCTGTMILPAMLRQSERMLNCMFSKRESLQIFERLKYIKTDWLDEVTARYLICYPNVHETEFDHHNYTDLEVVFSFVTTQKNSGFGAISRICKC